MIHRVIHNKENPYFQLNRTALEDRRLSWRAVGVLVYLLSKPDEWHIREKDLMARHKIGRDALRNTMRELRECGYITKTLTKNKITGKFDKWEAHVFEIPRAVSTWTPEEEEITDDEENQSPEKPATGKTGGRKTRPLSDTDLIVKKRDSETPPTKQIPRDVSGGLPGVNMLETATGDKPPTATHLLAAKMRDNLTRIFNDLDPLPLSRWKETLRRWHVNADVSLSEVESVLDWYIEHAKDPYVPTARSANSFCEKYERIKDARERWRQDMGLPSPKAEIAETQVAVIPEAQPRILSPEESKVRRFMRHWGLSNELYAKLRVLHPTETLEELDAICEKVDYGFLGPFLGKAVPDVTA